MFKMLLAQCVAVFLAAAVSPVYSDTFRVPSEFATVQGAIDASENGDTVIVAPGVYFENLTFLGKDIHVRSAEGPEVTILDGSALTRGPSFGSVVSFTEGETSDAVLEGFSVTGGSGTSVGGGDLGGGIVIVDSGATIRGNLIYGNPPPPPPFEQINSGAGVGIRNGTGVVITGNLIAENEAAVDGGGVLCNMVESLVLRDNIVTRNRASEHGGGIAVILSSPVVIEDCLLVENECFDSISFGAGFYVLGGGDVSIRRCTIADNFSELSCGGIAVHDTTLTIESSILWGNRAGAGLPTLLEQQLCALSGSSDWVVSFSNIEGDIVGPSSISEDPLFITGVPFEQPLLADLADYYLSQTSAGGAATSPSVDAGIPGVDPAGLGSTRIDDEPDTGILDMGYHYQRPRFLRGDANLDVAIDIGDAIAILMSLFIIGSEPPGCVDSADTNDDGVLDISDSIFLLSWLFVIGSEPPPAPGPDTCGVDPTPDTLFCHDVTCP